MQRKYLYFLLLALIHTAFSEIQAESESSEAGVQGKFSIPIKDTEDRQDGRIAPVTNLGGLASMLFFITAPIVYPMIVGASERASKNPTIQRRREETAERLFGPMSRMIQAMGNSMSKNNIRMRESIRRTGEGMRGLAYEIPILMRNTAAFTRERNYHNLRRMGQNVGKMFTNIASNYRRARARNSRNLRRMGNFLGSAAKTARNGFVRAARRIG